MAATATPQAAADAAATNRWTDEPVEVLYATNPDYPKFHLTAGCKGLGRVKIHDGADDADIAAHEFTSWQQLAEHTDGRPCRVCTLEKVLDLCLQAHGTIHPDRDDARFVTFSGQPTPREHLRRYKWREVSDTGRARLQRIAQRSDLQLTHTGVGPVAFGVLPEAVIDVLTRNLRTIVHPTHPRRFGTTPDDMQVQVVWTIATADGGVWEQIEQMGYDRNVVDPDTLRDPFEVAAALARADQEAA